MIKKLLIFVFITMCFTAGKQENNHFRGELGLRIPEIGFAVDALYDPKLDRLIPGYRIINVVLVNSSGEKIYLNPKKDQWKIDDAMGKARPAIVSLAHEKQSTWARLPEELQKNLQYPLSVDADERVVFSLFFKDTVDLREFRSISFYSSYLGKVMTYYTEGIGWNEKESA